MLERHEIAGVVAIIALHNGCEHSLESQNDAVFAVVGWMGLGLCSSDMTILMGKAGCDTLS